MAVSPSIPTSFVPKQPLDAPRRKMQPGDNIILLISIVVLAVSAVTAGAVFGYERYLVSAIETKSETLATERALIDESRVEDYVRLHKRFAEGRKLLDTHVAPSSFFTLLEGATLQNVSFDTLDMQVHENRSATVRFAGTARNFNTLAAQSNEVAARKEFKRAIFSGITINANGTVGFALTADLEPSVLKMKTNVEPAPVVEATTTPAAPAPAATTTTPAATTTPGL